MAVKAYMQRPWVSEGVTYGVLGRSNSPDGYGGYFSNTGVVGIGVFASAGNDDTADLVLGGNNGCR